MSERCLLVGAFWGREAIPNPLHMENFIGEVEIQADGTFVGTTKDAYGTAKITGKVTEGCLEFKKAYTQQRPGAGAHAKGTLTYILQRQFRNCGGWHGCYTQDREANPGGEDWEMTGSGLCDYLPQLFSTTPAICLTEV